MRINGKPAGRLGDSINCGGAVIVGSPNVIIGDEPFEGPGLYSVQFRAIDEDSGKPLPGVRYRLEKDDGGVVRGVTNDEGKTIRLVTPQPEMVHLYWETEDDFPNDDTGAIDGC